MIDGLTIVALPIGNPADVSSRVRECLQTCDGVLAEDTRKFLEFTRTSGITFKAPVVPLPAYVESETDFTKFFDKLKGPNWVLVSDAGTPVISDPGTWIIRAARLKKINLKALPGPSALTLSLQLTGGFGLPVIFLGFPPKKNKENFFANCMGCKTIIFFESKHEVLATLDHLSENALTKGKQVFLLRELTKVYEEVLQGSPFQLHCEVAKRLERGDPLGEMTLVLEGGDVADSGRAGGPSISELVEFRSASPSRAAQILARWTNLSREEAYSKLQNKDS